jgi:hypothetical protein
MWPPLWSSGQTSWRYQIFWEVVGLERGPLSLVSTIEELLVRNSSGSGLENREYGRGDPLRWPRVILYPQNLVLTSPRSLDRYSSPAEFVCWWLILYITLIHYGNVMPETYYSPLVINLVTLCKWCSNYEYSYRKYPSEDYTLLYNITSSYGWPCMYVTTSVDVAVACLNAVVQDAWNRQFPVISSQVENSHIAFPVL